MRGLELSENIVIDYLNRIPPEEKFSSDNLKFMADFTGSQKLQEIAFDYLQGLPREAFAQKRIKNFALAFCNGKNSKVPQLCLNYLKSLTKKEFADTMNLKFASALAPIPEVQQLLATYLKNLSKQEFEKKMNQKYLFGLTRYSSIQIVVANYLNKIKLRQLGTKQNIDFAIACNKNEQVKVKINEYLSYLNENEYDKKDIIRLINSFIHNYSDPGFKFFYIHAPHIDSIMDKKDNAEDKIDAIISETIIIPAIKLAEKSGSTPDFDAMHNTILGEYSTDYADRNILNAQVNYYRGLSGKEPYTKKYFLLLNEQYSKYGEKYLPLGGINNIAWNLFLHSDNREYLLMALRWSEKSIQSSDPYYVHILYDTYANILYKLGRVSEAIDWEKKRWIIRFPSNMRV